MSQIKKIDLMIAFLATSFSLLLGSVGHATENAKQKYSDWILEKTIQMNDYHAPAHAFLIHMGIPGNSGKLSTRIMSVAQRTNDYSLNENYAFHPDAGIIDRLGLCLRNDAVKFKKSANLMLHYAVLKSDYALNGVSLIVNWNFPREVDQALQRPKAGRSRAIGSKNTSRSSASNSCSDCVGAIFLGCSFFL